MDRRIVARPGTYYRSVALALAVLAGLLPAGGARAAGLQASPGEEYIAVSCMGNLEFFRAHKYAWKWIGDKLGVKTSYVGPAEYDVPGQIAAFDQAIARKPAGIAVFGVEPSLKPSIDKAMAAGIPVVTFTGDVPDSKRLTYVGTNQYDIGFFAGKKLAEAIGGSGEVAVLSIPGVPMFDLREKGYRDGLAASAGVKIVQTGDTKADTVTAINTAKAIMQRFPNLTAFACTDSTGGIAAATAVSEAGKAGKIKIFSMDRNSDVLEKIKAGAVTATVAQDDAAVMVWSMMVLYSRHHFEAPLTTDNRKANVVAEPMNVFTSVSLVDRNNVQYFLDANKLYSR